MIEYAWIAAGLSLVAFIFVVASIFTIRGTINSDRNKQEIAMIPLYVAIILIFLSSILSFYVVFKETEVPTCIMPYSGKKIQMVPNENSNTTFVSSIN